MGLGEAEFKYQEDQKKKKGWGVEAHEKDQEKIRLMWWD
jgi:hypothetical protein